ncbi:DUF6361 family protein [Janthinobacterium sp. NFX145]|uniref:DUF6361 family protein n=1 Tax=Janthinobacterium sp. NFX145 TaxID=3415602 RepID=UPI003CC56692
MIRFGWVDFSSDDRTRVQQVLALLKEPGTLDELGIGQVRDAFSDLLFPGFSTIQTRARYFLAVPHILLDWASLSPKKRRNLPLERYLLEAENELARTLKTNHEIAGLPLDGIIGHTMVESGGVARRPSSTYWNGLKLFNIINSPKSLAEFCRDWKRDAGDYSAVDAEEGSDDADHRFESDVRRPPGARGTWRDDVTLNLSKAEADFLSVHFCTLKELEHSVAGQLLSTELADSALEEKYKRFASFSVWASQQTSLSLISKGRIAQAQRFSDAIEGAHIIFNGLLAHEMEDDDLAEKCLGYFSSWRARVAHSNIFHSGALVEWLDAPRALGITVNPRTVAFLDDWNEAMLNAAPKKKLEGLVRAQALKNKPGRSLLVRLPRTKSTWYGMKELEYRWSTARGMLSDVMEGKKCLA